MKRNQGKYKIMTTHILMLTPDCYMIDRRILQEASSLSDSGYRVTLIAGGECDAEEHYELDGIAVHRFVYDWDDGSSRMMREFIKNEKLKIWFHRAFCYLARTFFHFNSFDYFIYEKAKQYKADIVHVHDLPFLKHGARLAREWNVPLVYDAHEIYYEQEVLTASVRRRLKKEEKKYASQVDLFITVNDALARYFARLHRITKPLVLYNCTDEFVIDSGADPLKKALGKKGDEFIVLFQGWISEERNLCTVVSAVKYFHEGIHLAVIGYGEYLDYLIKLRDDLGLQDKITFLGKIEASEIMNYTAGADLGLIPYLPIDLNHKYCSPNKFFEYIQAGVPVLANKLEFFIGMKKQYGVVEVCDYTDPSEVADYVNRLIGTEQLREMGNSCRSAAKTLNWSVESRMLISAYSQL